MNRNPVDHDELLKEFTKAALTGLTSQLNPFTHTPVAVAGLAVELGKVTLAAFLAQTEKTNAH